jgi:hypothetical protein
MITPLLERAIMSGKAVYSKYTHAMGMYGSLKIPEGKIVIILDIKWHSFINPYKNVGTITVKEFFKYNEYQLKIDGFKSHNFMTFRNRITKEDLLLGGVQDTDLISTINGLFYTLSPGEPIQQDVYFICEKYIRITISRNAFFNALNSTYSTLNAVAAEQNVPNGVGNVPVLNRLQMASATPATMFYTPPGNTNAGLTIPAGGRNAETYTQDLDATNSQIYPPDTGFNATLGTPTLTQPLVEFGIVTINSNEFNNLMNS